jgi:hypothetical protein
MHSVQDSVQGPTLFQVLPVSYRDFGSLRLNFAFDDPAAVVAPLVDYETTSASPVIATYQNTTADFVSDPPLDSISMPSYMHLIQDPYGSQLHDSLPIPDSNAPRSRRGLDVLGCSVERLERNASLNSSIALPKKRVKAGSTREW